MGGGLVRVGSVGRVLVRFLALTFKRSARCESHMVEVEGRLERLDDHPFEVAERVASSMSSGTTRRWSAIHWLSSSRTTGLSNATSSTEPKVRRSVLPLLRPRRCWLLIRLKRGAAWQPRGPAGRARLSDIDETRLDVLTQSRGQRPSTLFVDKPAVETTSVQLQTLESRELSRAVCLGGIGERGDHWCRVTGEDRISTLLNSSLDRASRVVPALPAPAGEPLQGGLDHSPSLLEWASNRLRVALACVQLNHGPRESPQQ